MNRYLYLVFITNSTCDSEYVLIVTKAILSSWTNHGKQNIIFMKLSRSTARCFFFFYIFRIINYIFLVINSINIYIDKISIWFQGFHWQKDIFTSCPLPTLRYPERNLVVNALHRLTNLLVVPLIVTWECAESLRDPAALACLFHGLFLFIVSVQANRWQCFLCLAELSFWLA